jgi:hypothetical protein
MLLCRIVASARSAALRAHLRGSPVRACRLLLRPPGGGDGLEVGFDGGGCGRAGAVGVAGVCAGDSVAVVALDPGQWPTPPPVVARFYPQIRCFATATAAPTPVAATPTSHLASGRSRRRPLLDPTPREVSTVRWQPISPTLAARAAPPPRCLVGCCLWVGAMAGRFRCDALRATPTPAIPPTCGRWPSGRCPRMATAGTAVAGHVATLHRGGRWPRGHGPARPSGHQSTRAEPEAGHRSLTVTRVVCSRGRPAPTERLVA